MKQIGKKLKKVVGTGTLALLLVATMAMPSYAATKTIDTDRGEMKAFASGYYLSQTKEKAVDYSSTMLDGKTSKLYLTSLTVKYSTGATVHSVPRWGGYSQTSINDYFYLTGYENTTLKTYTTHEAIYTNAYTAYLSVIY